MSTFFPLRRRAFIINGDLLAQVDLLGAVLQRKTPKGKGVVRPMGVQRHIGGAGKDRTGGNGLASVGRSKPAIELIAFAQRDGQIAVSVAVRTAVPCPTE